MFHYYTASDFLHEIRVKLSKCKSSVELLIDELDFVILADDLIELSRNDLIIELIIQGISNEKSLRLIHLMNRISRQGTSTYWIYDPTIDRESISYGIFDKTSVVSKSNLLFDESSEEKIYNINDLHSHYRTLSKQYINQEGQIEILFSADKSIVSKNEVVKLRWNVKNANYVSFEFSKEFLDFSGEKEFKIEKDTEFKLIAENATHKQLKRLYVKMIDQIHLNVHVTAYDPILDEYIELQTDESSRSNYYAFLDQKILIYWSTQHMGVLHEESLGILNLNGHHEFTLSGSKLFSFKLDTVFGNFRQKIKIHPVIPNRKKPWLIGFIQSLFGYSKSHKGLKLF